MPIAREPVTIRGFRDGTLIDERTSERLVHRPGNAAPYIRVLGRSEPLTHDGPAVIERHARTVGRRTWDDVRADIAERAAAAGASGVRVIGLGD